MKKIRIIISNEQGSVLDEEEVEIGIDIASDATKLRRAVSADFADLNWNRISNLLADD